MKIAVAVSILCLFFFCGCSKDEGIAEIDIDFVWDTEHLNRSPEVHLKNVPEGVDRLKIYFYDDTASGHEHGGGILPYDGSGIIQAGAFKEFKGLTNLWGIPKIRATVKAFDKNGQLVGKGTITKNPPDQ